MNWKFWQKKVLPSPVIFIDGDQDFRYFQRAMSYVMVTGHQMYWVTTGNVPRKILHHPRFIIVMLNGVSSRGKETSDKYIGIAIQQEISKGVRDITVVSSDYDFVDIFKMLIMVNPTLELNFTLVATNAKGRLLETESTSRITITRM